MKKILVLSMVVVLAFSGFAFAGEVGHLDPEKFSATPVVVIVGAAGEVDLEGLVDFDDSHPISENFALVGLSSLQSLIDNLNAHFHNKQSSIGTIEDASAAKFCVLRINTVTTEEQTLVFKIDGTAINNAFNTESVEVGQNLHLVLLNSDGTTFSDFTLNVSVNYREFSIVDEDGNPVSRIEKGKSYYVIKTLVPDPNSKDYAHAGSVLVQPNLVNVTTESGGGGGGGCNAGFSLIAGVLVLSGLAFRKRGR